MSDKKRRKKQRITVQDTLREILQPEQPGYLLYTCSMLLLCTFILMCDLVSAAVIPGF